MPSWDVMCTLKNICFNDDEVVMELHPAKKDYVNNHEYCLHIWKPINLEIPMPPSIMIGLKKDYSDKEFSELINLIKNDVYQHILLI